MTDVYVVYQTPYVDGLVDFDPVFAKKVLDATNADGLRLNFDWRSDRNRELLDAVAEADKKLVPVIDLPYEYNISNYRRVAELAAQLVDWLTDTSFAGRVPFLEVGSEPYTDRAYGGRRRISSGRYCELFGAISQAAKGRIPLALALDGMRPDGWKHRRWVEWARRVVYILPDRIWDIAAIHPYREGDPGYTRVHWPNWVRAWEWLGKSVWGERDREVEMWEWELMAKAKPMAITEVGWTRKPERSDETIAGYITRELQLAGKFGIETVCVRAHRGDEWGVVDDDGSARAQADAIRRWVAVRDKQHQP